MRPHSYTHKSYNTNVVGTSGEQNQKTQYESQEPGQETADTERDQNHNS